MSMNMSYHWDAAMKMGMPANAVFLVIDAAAQALFVLENGVLTGRYDISTSSKGLGNRLDSNQTPTGWHRVVERYGDQAEPGTVFRDRQPTGEVMPPHAWRGSTPGDRILSRILRLAGLVPGINQGGDVDTFNREIYLHGTHQEDAIGRPASAGCIRLRNADIVGLYTRTVGREIWCWIGPCASASHDL